MSRKKKPPVDGVADGPDKKGRHFLNLPNSGKPLLFHSGIRGEEVRVRRGKRGRRGEQGDLLEVLTPATNRREAQCQHFGVCGGCTMQQLDEASALTLKTRPHYDMLRAVFPQAEFEPPVASPQAFAYRTKVELTFLSTRAGGETLGFHRRGRFDRGVDVGRCWLTPLSTDLIHSLRLWRDRHGLKGWDPHTNTGDLRYFVYRHASRSTQDLAALVVNRDSNISADAQDDLRSRLQDNQVSGAVLVQQSSVAGAVVPETVNPLFGEQVLKDRVGSLEFELGWNSFFQVNPRAYERLLEVMRQWRQTPAGGELLDLFCGVGSIGLSLYKPGDKLLGVELVEQAVLDARANADRNGIEARFEHRSAESVLEFQTDLLILDPPRSGCHPKLLKRLREVAPAEELFYVSCNPHRLKEELEELQVRYRLVRAQAFDFFPQTHHVEMLLQFTRR
jgi:23S rRNA (uracil1939-C5)-methyltransferase